MHIKRIKKKSGVYLAQYESYRDEDGNVKTKYCGYLGKEGEEKGMPLPKKSAHVETPLYPEISKRAGDVKLMWAIAVFATPKLTRTATSILTSPKCKVII